MSGYMPRWGSHDTVRNTFFVLPFLPFEARIKRPTATKKRVSKGSTCCDVQLLGSCLMMLSASPPSHTPLLHLQCFCISVPKQSLASTCKKHILNRSVFHHRNNHTAQTKFSLPPSRVQFRPKFQNSFKKRMRTRNLMLQLQKLDHSEHQIGKRAAVWICLRELVHFPMFHDIETYQHFQFWPKKYGNKKNTHIFFNTHSNLLFFGWKRPGTVLSTSSSCLRSSTWKSWPCAPSRTPWPATPGARLRPALRWWHGSSGTAGTAAMSWVRLEVMAWQSG